MSGGEEAVGAFQRATAVAPVGEGLYKADVDGAWGAPTGPNGGYLAALATRALEAHVNHDRARRLRSLTCHYLRPAAAGELDVHVETIREGRRLSSARFTASQGGKPVFTGLAAFAVPGLEGAAQWSPIAPEVPGPPPGDAGDAPRGEYRPDGGRWLEVPPRGAPSVIEQVRVAPVLGEWPFSGVEVEPGNAAETAAWIALPEPAPLDSARVMLLTDVWVPPAFGVLDRPAIAPTIDLTVHIRADLGEGGLDDQPVLGHYASSEAEAGLVEEDGRLFLTDGTLVAHSRQLALLVPVDEREVP